MKKRPFATEGHLHLPRELGPAGSPQAGAPQALSPQAASSEADESHAGPTECSGVVLLPPGEGRLAGARLLDDRHLHLDLHTGDEVLFIRGRQPEYGDLVLLTGPPSRPQIWKAYPEAGELRLLAGPHRRTLRSHTGRDNPLLGVIVAVKRPLYS